MPDIPTTKSPHTFAKFTTKKDARIYRIPMEGFPNFWVYAYLVFVDEKLILIDTGSGFGNSNQHLLDGFERARADEGLDSIIDKLDYILITHGHIDHFGGLPFLVEQTDAKVGIHELDLRNLTNFEERILVSERRLREFLIEAGVDEEKQVPLAEYDPAPPTLRPRSKKRSSSMVGREFVDSRQHFDCVAMAASSTW